LEIIAKGWEISAFETTLNFKIDIEIKNVQTLHTTVDENFAVTESKTFNFTDSSSPAGGATSICFLASSSDIGPTSRVWHEVGQTYSSVTSN